MLSEEYKIMYNAETNYWWYKGLHELILHFIRKKTDKQISILDAGCGTGGLLELLSEYNCQGFDFSAEAIKFCDFRHLNNVFVQDINTWQRRQKFDVIISADVICSIGISDEKSIIENFYSSLKTNGILILNLPAFEILRRNHDKAVFVRKRYTHKDIKKLLLESGFVDFYISYRLPWLFFIILAKKIFQKISNNTTAESDLKTLPEFLNSFFLLLHRIDNFFVQKRVRIPFGSSLFVVAQKK